MMTKCLIVLLAVVAVCSAGILPAAVPAALTVGTYATSYNAHSINHAIAAPYVAAAASPYVAAASPYVAAASPYVAAASPYVAAAAYPAAYPALGAYSAYPYASAPYVALR